MSDLFIPLEDLRKQRNLLTCLSHRMLDPEDQRLLEQLRQLIDAHIRACEAKG